jgi:CAAX prenyl protease-like protein
MRPQVLEMRWAFSGEAVAVGIGVFAIWVGLDPLYPHLFKTGATGNPNEQFGAGSAPAWFFIAVHIAGMTLVVPPLEEVFYRSFLYRYLANQNFLSVPLNRFQMAPFCTTAIVFGLSHNEWLAGVLCGALYQWLVIRKNRLGDAMTAHAITNFLLGAWIVWRGAWHFW